MTDARDEVAVAMTSTSGNCVEIAALPDDGRAVRDSQDPDGPVLFLTAGQWTELAQSRLGTSV